MTFQDLCYLHQYVLVSQSDNNSASLHPPVIIITRFKSYRWPSRTCVIYISTCWFLGENSQLMLQDYLQPWRDNRDSLIIRHWIPTIWYIDVISELFIFIQCCDFSFDYMLTCRHLWFIIIWRVSDSVTKFSINLVNFFKFFYLIKLIFISLYFNM